MGNKLGRRRVVVDDKYTRPQGLYQHRDVDHKKLRKLILDSKLAPCYPGDEDCAADLDECPICFLYYPSLNRSRCCMKGICTECFLQMKPPHSARPTQCPFCKTSNYAVEYRGVKTKEEKGKEQIEEQRVIEAKIRMQQQQRQNDEEKMQKRQALSSSRIMFPGEVGYQDIASSSVSVTDVKHAAQGGEVLSSQSSCALAGNLRPSSSGQIREDETDMDLEEMMVMEAIWLSIQEQRSTSNGPSISPIASSSADEYPMHAIIPVESYHSNELACAVGAVGQSQHINEDGTNSAEISSGSFRTISHLNCISNGDKSLVGNCSQGDWVDRSFHDGTMALREDSEWAADHSSNVAEAGTSYSSSDVMFDGGTVLPCPDVLNMPAGHLLPETFEEQMMLAMAVSLADSRARTNTQGIPWL